jgi:hypothetical protein
MALLRPCLIVLLLASTGCAGDPWPATGPVSEPVEFAPTGDPVDASGATPEVCDNGLDDDLDSLLDCADPECAGLDLCVVEDDRTSIRFEGGLWATFVADDDQVYEDSGGLDGALLVRRETRRLGVWTVDCQTRVAVAGVPISEAIEADLHFSIVPILPVEHDGCSFGAALPSLPGSVRLERETGDVLADYDDAPVPWAVVAGTVDWSGWSSALDYHVDSQGTPLMLASPEEVLQR